MGKTPKQFLASVDSAELAELFAYFVLQKEEADLARSKATSGHTTEEAITNIFGEAPDGPD